MPLISLYFSMSQHTRATVRLGRPGTFSLGWLRLPEGLIAPLPVLQAHRG